MKTTLEGYINNPMGTGSGVITGKQMILQGYQNSFNKIMKDCKGQFETFLLTKEDTYYIYLKVPSETVQNFTYDIVLEFEPPNQTIKAQANIKNYNVKFYSNDPRFLYVWAYAFNKQNLLIEDLKPKISKKALTTAPKVTNKNKDIGYVKTFVFAYYYIKQKNLFTKAMFQNYGRKYSKTFLLKNIENSVAKASSRQAQIEDNKKAEADFKNLAATGKGESLNTKKNGIGRLGNVHTINPINKIKSSINRLGHYIRRK